MYQATLLNLCMQLEATAAFVVASNGQEYQSYLNIRHPPMTTVGHRDLSHADSDHT